MACTAHKLEVAKLYREANRELIRQKDRELYLKRRKQVLMHKHEYYVNNKEKVLNRSYKRYIAKADILKSKRREYVKHNMPKVRALNAKRRADSILRTPKWADLEKIKQVYINCPKGMVVDHIVPLRGKNVSGLHVHTNLQYLTPSENSHKGNRF